MIKTRRIVVISGLAFSGKSTLIEELRREPEFQQFEIFHADPYRARLQERLGRPLLIPEHRFKNEALYLDMKTELVFGEKSTIVEMALKTESNHYQPLSEMVQSTNRYLSDIHQAKATSGQITGLERVECAVISLYCDVPAVRRRVKQRVETIAREGNVTQTDVFDLRALRNSGVNEFEFPNSVKPLFVDTSSESLHHVRTRLLRIKQFIFEGQTFAPREYEERVIKAQKALTDLKVAVN